MVSARGELILYELKIEHGIAMVEMSGSDRISRSSLCFDPDCLSSSNHPDAPLPPPWTGAVNIGPSLQCNLSEFTKVRNLPAAERIHPKTLCQLTAYSSVNLAPMPHEYLPFHMSLSSMGLVFSNYESTLFVANRITNEILTRAIRAVSIDLARNPELESRPVRDVFLKWTHPVAQIALYVEPQVPNLTFGGMYGLFYLLQIWAREYQTEQCSFLIWAWPGTTQQKLLGQGHLLMDPDPPLKSSKRI
ncbi:MAG: hypothetical protein LQ348_003757 [Seirophora lacunosa]|nr:MAG: hypothetical protein LQ348_003757 [Seirophora lacunosa]